MSKSTDTSTGLARLREPFKPEEIGKLPKPTKFQTDTVKANYKTGVRCSVCGGWHHPDVIHLDYVGHAALTNRFLEVDETWFWEPMATDDQGLPVYDKQGGLWICLTILGVTRLGYGHAGTKTGGDAIKEVIGDALRNSGMRFGCALDLWHKSDIPLLDTDDNSEEKEDVVEKSMFDKGKIWIDDHIKKESKPEDLQAGWDKYIESAMENFTEQEQADLRADLKSTLQILTEMHQGDK